MQDRYYSMTTTGQLVVFDYRQYLGEQLYWMVKASLAETEAYLKEVDFWHEATTPERVVGIIMAAGYPIEELVQMVSDETVRNNIIADALELILEAAKEGTVFRSTGRSKPHPDQRTPVWQTLSPVATQAVLGMKPLF
jgi:hypothetical protein